MSGKNSGGGGVGCLGAIIIFVACLCCLGGNMFFTDNQVITKIQTVENNNQLRLIDTDRNIFAYSTAIIRNDKNETICYQVDVKFMQPFYGFKVQKLGSCP